MGNNVSMSDGLGFTIVYQKQGAQYYLDSAEKEDFYLEECHDDKANSLARKNLTYIANQISLRDYNYAKAYVENSINFLPVKLLDDLKDIKIIQLFPTADGGMPHTRPGNIICYPDISQLFSKTTLIHELWHIHQRNYKDLWFKTFKRMGWVIWNGHIPENLDKARRFNPDTLDCPFWIFENEWIPIPIFRDISKPNVADVEIWFYNPHKEYHIKRIPESLQSYIPDLPPSAYEHPREITAYMLSEPGKYKDSTGYKHLIESIGHISVITKNIS